ncbi:thioredoxin family protein [Bombella sp. TMW 2.2559]|uniref:Thioredoxin family protein n=1 Tax=Bombella dulcis TaxID=2967339 RepID=A0ABT3WGK0_9PROT|nr:thioredoxin family protein [Bombella dulcis]MCX5616001.1 thioredoxin family protein [Bombella dulcis]
MRFHHPALILAGLMATLPAGAAPAPAPLPDISKMAAITPARAPYPPADLATKQVHEAFLTAARTNRRVLLDFGGNWCPDCRILAGIFAVPSVSLWLDEHFVVVPVNVGHFDTNMELTRQYGVTIKAVPTVLVLTPQGRLLNPDGTLALGSARQMTPQSVITLLNEWNQRP